MNAHNLIHKLLEAVDPDDPEAFIRNYKNAWERAGFQLDEEDDVKYVWQEGIFSVEATQLGREGAWEIYAYIADVPEYAETGLSAIAVSAQSAYARKTAKTEEKALATAIRLRHELATSMAAKLVKLGFVGWRNHWHKAPITVTLKSSKNGGYANINLQMQYLPNDTAIKALTKLDKLVADYCEVSD